MQENNTTGTGRVKWFNTTKGYGFITPDDNSKDIFVHISAIEKSGLTQLNENEKVSYEIATANGKASATNIKLITS